MVANPPTSQIFQKTKKPTGSNKLPKYSWIFYFKKPTFLLWIISVATSQNWKKEKRKKKRKTLIWTWE
jgi:hypothetical protein